MTKRKSVRIVVESKEYGDPDWQKTTLVELYITEEEKEEIIRNLGWLTRFNSVFGVKI